MYSKNYISYKWGENAPVSTKFMQILPLVFILSVIGFAISAVAMRRFRASPGSIESKLAKFGVIGGAIFSSITFVLEKFADIINR
jgi:hypothetical protein